jgi:hypothetical protein
VIPWLILAAVVVPLVVVAFLATRRRNTAEEHAAQLDPKLDEEFAAAEAFEEEWREEDHERYRKEHLP